MKFFTSKESKNWLSKGLMGLMALSMLGGLGLSDMLRRSRSTYIAKVGSQELSVENFIKLVQERKGQMEKATGRPVPLTEFVSLGEARGALEAWIDGALLESHAQTLGIRIPDRVVRHFIEQNTDFADEQGKFSWSKYQSFLNKNNLTAKEYVQKSRALLVQQQFFLNLARGAELTPALLSKAVMQALTQKRSGRWAFIPYKATTVPAPSMAELRNLYVTDPQLSRVPEKRSFILVRLNPARLASAQQVTQAEIDDVIARIKQQQEEDTPFPTAQEIRAALQFSKAQKAVRTLRSQLDKALEEGLSLQEAAHRLGLTVEKFHKLPLQPSGESSMTKLEPEVLQYIGSLTLGDESVVAEMLPSDIAVAAVVTEIEPEKILTFEQAQPLLKTTWQKRQQEILTKRRAQDSLGQLNQGKELSLQWQDIPSVTLEEAQEGPKTPQQKGKKTEKALADVPPLMQNSINMTLFELGIGKTSILHAPDGVYLVQLTKIIQPESFAFSVKIPEKIRYSVQQLMERSWGKAYIEIIRPQYKVVYNEGMYNRVIKELGGTTERVE